MSFRVIIEPRAEADLEAAYLWAKERAPTTAARWLNRFHKALESLSALPERCGVAPESSDVDIEVRQLLFGHKPNVWRALFAIDGDEVRVLHVRRAAMENAGRSDLGL